jgi:hypothetical protein
MNFYYAFIYPAFSDFLSLCSILDFTRGAMGLSGGKQVKAFVAALRARAARDGRRQFTAEELEEMGAMLRIQITPFSSFLDVSHEILFPRLNLLLVLFVS